MAIEDKTLACRECSNEFVFTVGEQEFYQQKGLVQRARPVPYVPCGAPPDTLGR